ncbi:MAG TPA: mechanosensitive ion channel family protein [Candidatus Cybelea sp.]|nr:mechanosensitive ion channel family protein [Candidatus Cybelea sp.]
MKQKIAAIALLVLLGASLYGFIRTGEPASAPNNAAKTAMAGLAQGPIVDQTPLLTAQRLAQIPTSAEEQPFAEEALRLADHDMDLAYAAAEREAEEHPPALSAEAKQIEARLEEAEDALDADNTLVERLTAEEAKATGAKKDAVHDQLILATAHQEEHQDEVDDAKEDLERAGGDRKSRIEAMMQEHKASSAATDALHVKVTTTAEERGLIHRFEQWLAFHQKQLLLWQAKQEAESAAAALTAKHNLLEGQIAAEKKNTVPAAGQASASPGAASGANKKAPTDEALLKATKQRAAGRKALASFDKQIDDQKQLAENYGTWIAALQAKQRTVLHGALNGLSFILGILLIGIFFDSWLERLLGKTSLDRRQIETMRTLTRVSVQVCAVLFILLVIFGPPSQLGTILGLAGAGLTVALKDFIVGFLGWFVLMGKNGIRLGDWVEINGVTGEVVELGVFHTVLLETGNWTDSGHPTGRRVTFTNSYAIEGHYFNFSTSGQWMWDELQVVLPAGQDPYPVIDAIQNKVTEATTDNAKQAEQEWQRAAKSRQMVALSAAPAINVKPVVGGIEIAVRYITRANERYQLRAKLYQVAVELLGGKSVQLPASPNPVPSS